MIGCLRTRVRKQPIIALYFEFENELKFYNLEACFDGRVILSTQIPNHTFRLGLRNNNFTLKCFLNVDIYQVLVS